jgi:hypothetical protein
MSWLRRHSLTIALALVMTWLFCLTVASAWHVEREEAIEHGEKPPAFWSGDFWWPVWDRLAPESTAEIFGMLLLVLLLAAGALEIKAKEKEEKGEAGGAS